MTLWCNAMSWRMSMALSWARARAKGCAPHAHSLTLPLSNIKRYFASFIDIYGPTNRSMTVLIAFKSGIVHSAHEHNMLCQRPTPSERRDSILPITQPFWNLHFQMDSITTHHA